MWQISYVNKCPYTNIFSYNENIIQKKSYNNNSHDILCNVYLEYDISLIIFNSYY